MATLFTIQLLNLLQDGRELSMVLNPSSTSWRTLPLLLWILKTIVLRSFLAQSKCWIKKNTFLFIYLFIQLLSLRVALCHKQKTLGLNTLLRWCIHWWETWQSQQDSRCRPHLISFDQLLAAFVTAVDSSRVSCWETRPFYSYLSVLKWTCMAELTTHHENRLHRSPLKSKGAVQFAEKKKRSIPDSFCHDGKLRVALHSLCCY